MDRMKIMHEYIFGDVLGRYMNIRIRVLNTLRMHETFKYTSQTDTRPVDRSKGQDEGEYSPVG